MGHPSPHFALACHDSLLVPRPPCVRVHGFFSVPGHTAADTMPTCSRVILGSRSLTTCSGPPRAYFMGSLHSLKIRLSQVAQIDLSSFW